MSKHIKIEVRGKTTFAMQHIPGGSFEMGSNKRTWEKPPHPVTVRDFYLGIYPVTQALYEAVMSENPSHFKGRNRPVEKVSWHDAKQFIKALNKDKAIKEQLKSKGLSNYSFRLPSEAEWEYAAKGHPDSSDYEYSGSDNLKQVGWYRGNSGRETKPVGLLLPNELGLYDMSGNVWEWCEDDWHDNYKKAPDDGSAWIDKPERGGLRVMRGGSCFGGAVGCRAAYRDYYRPGSRGNGVGFRVACSPPV